MLESTLRNEKFAIFCTELLKWSKIHNLTSYKTEAQIYENIEDSIYPLEFIDDFHYALDIGSGSGFPAIPLAIIKAESSFVLLEPNAKKAAFLYIVSLLCKLNNVRIVKQSIEDFCVHQPHQSVDLITSRALYDSKKLISISGDLLSDNGKFLFYKGTQFISESHKKIVESSEKSNNYIIRNQRIYFYTSKQEVF